MGIPGSIRANRGGPPQTAIGGTSEHELEQQRVAAHIRSVWLLIIINIVGKAAAIHIGLASPVTALALWFSPDALLAYHLFVPQAQGVVRSCLLFTTARREVWLTIDDGPDPDDTPKILELLKTHHARATFFVIGQNAAAHPELIQAIKAAGHETGYHTNTHPAGSFWCATPERLAREMDPGLAQLQTLGVTPIHFRPPVGIKNPWLAPMLAERKLVCIGWSARGLELQGGGAEAVAARVLRGLRPGSILLLHEGPRLPPKIRVLAIRQTLENLRDLGYKCIIPERRQLRGL